MGVFLLINIHTNLEINLIREIGMEGANSKVYLARDPQLNENLVVKQIPKQDFANVDDYFKEAQMIYQTKHPHIVEIQYASQDNDNIYFAMPFFKNGSLNSLLQSRTLSLREIVKYSLDFLTGLHYVHVKNITHLDIKPTNLLISDSNKVLITDFGLSKYVNNSGFAIQDYFYTFHKPPEAFSTHAVTVLADIYQAGITIYRMCNGVECLEQQIADLGIRNYQEFENAVLSGTFPNRKKYNSSIPTKLKTIINKAMSVNPNDRYQSTLEMMNDLAKIAP